MKNKSHGRFPLLLIVMTTVEAHGMFFSKV
jgi:hypothetical protein